MKQKLFLFFSLVISSSDLIQAQDCLTVAQLEDAALTTKSIPTDGSCDSPADDGQSCSLFSSSSAGDTDRLDIEGDLTILSCYTVNLSSTIATRVRGENVTVEAGAVLNIDDALRIESGGTLTVNGTLNTSGGGTIAIPDGSLIVGVGGAVNIDDSNITVGASGSLVIDGEMDVSGNVSLNSSATLSGNGTLTFGGNFNNSGDGSNLSGSYSGCSGSNSSCGGSLPVTLTQFYAEKLDHKVRLRWSTSSEIDNNGFYVERSTNGEDFKKIAFVKGHGSTNEKQTYSYSDDIDRSDVFYRLKQIDFDGQYEYSSIIKVSFALPLNPSFFPNPVTDKFEISVQNNLAFDLSLLDLNGNELLKRFDIYHDEASIAVRHQLDAAPRGLYLLKFQADNQVYTVRLIK